MNFQDGWLFGQLVGIFRIDVSYMDDEECAECMNQRFNNERKTRIVKLSQSFKYLRIKYRLPDSGKVIKKNNCQGSSQVYTHTDW